MAVLTRAERDRARVDRCHFKLVNDLLDTCDALEAERDKANQEAAEFGAAWHQAEKLARAEMDCRVANQESVGRLLARWAALKALSRQWRTDAANYPNHEAGEYAAAAVRLCAKELDDKMAELEKD